MPERTRLTLRPGVLAILVGLLLLSLAFLTGCAEPAAIAPVEPTPTAFPPPPTDIPAPPPGPTPAALDFPLSAPTDVEEARPVSDQNCVDCHTDEETLKVMAEEEQGGENESLSEGEG
ncbi:hypothetical protein ACFLWA_02070 [Chloroflexota bacterium]